MRMCETELDYDRVMREEDERKHRFIVSVFLGSVLAVVAFFLWVGGAWGDELLVPKPSVRFSASPRVASAFPGKPVVITLRLVIENTDERMWCPSTRWLWPNGTESLEEVDCPRYAETTMEDRRWQSWVKRARMGIPGDYEFVVLIERNGKVLRKESQTVMLR